MPTVLKSQPPDTPSEASPIPCRLDLAPDTVIKVHVDLALPSQG